MGAGAAHLPYLEVSALEQLLMLASPAREMAGEWAGLGSYCHLGIPLTCLML